MEVDGVGDAFLEGVNSDALIASLRQVDISVPDRTAGRTTHHTETWAISRLLATLATTSLLKYPLSVYHRDRPDFLLKTAGIEIGIEITEATSPQYAKYCALAEREFPNALLEPAHFRWGAPDLSVDDMRALLRESRLTSDGWVGDGPEQEWAKFIQSTFDTKLRKLRHEDFTQYPKNWLGVYDNTPLLDIDIDKAVALLCPLIQDYWAVVPSFDALFIEHDRSIIALTASSADRLILNDLWR